MTAPVEAYVTALAGLRNMGPARLRRLLRQMDPRSAWERVCDGRETHDSPSSQAPRLPFVEARDAPSWADQAASVDVEDLWGRCRRGRIRVTWPGHEQWPPRLDDGPQPPGVVFWRGDLGALEAPAVALIGTRRATPDGRSVAFELGRELAAAGVVVVSGLALGIDGAAHAGALEVCESGAGVAAPVGVAAGGVDVVYPRRHADLWRRVVAAGVVLSETPPGAPPAAWRFPARNRIIAALVQLVVVVESHVTGGSMVTVEAAIARGVDVGAVPGPVHSQASAGTNQLLRDGAAPVRHADDILDDLGMVGRLASPRPRTGRTPPPRAEGEARPVGPGGGRPAGVKAEAPGPPGRTDRAASPLNGEEERVLAALAWHPTSYNQVIERTALSPGQAGRCLDRLEAAGLAVRCSGRWSRAVP